MSDETQWWALKFASGLTYGYAPSQALADAWVRHEQGRTTEPVPAGVDVGSISYPAKKRREAVNAYRLERKQRGVVS